MRCLVIGSDGFVGQSFCSYLAGQGNEVVRCDIKRGPSEDARKITLPLDRVDAVYFLAWDVGGAKYLYRSDTQLDQLDWNLALMQNVFSQLRGCDIPFLFVSSQLADDLTSVYGVTKRLGQFWSGLLPQGVCVRLWNVYGAYEDSTLRSHVVADFVHQALDRGEIRMLTTGDECRQFVHIDDVCCGFHAALKGRVKQVCDVSSFEWVRVLDVARAIGEMTGAKVIPGDRAGSTVMIPNFQPVPGWMPKVDLHTGLARMVKDFLRKKK